MNPNAKFQKLFLSAMVLLCLTESGRGVDAQNVSLTAAELRQGWQSYTNGDYANSLAHYQSAAKASPESLDARLGCLLPLLALKRYEDAETQARRILREHPANGFAALRLVCALRLQNKYSEAAAVLSESLVRHPTDVSLLLELALVRLAQSQDATARQLFADVLTLDPENAVAWEQLGAPRLRGCPMDKPLTPEKKVRIEGAVYCGYTDYHGTASKDYAENTGAYVSLDYAGEHLLEVEADELKKYYRGFPSLEQQDFTVAYANYSLPHLKLRCGAHLICSQDPYTDQGRLFFGGAEYFVANAWAAGLDGYLTQYPQFQNSLNVVQLTPHLGITFGQGRDCVWQNVLRGYWIHLDNPDWGRENVYSAEDQLTFRWRRWHLSGFGWVGQQLFAARNDGFALYNLGERHRAGYGAEVGCAITPHLALTLRACREEFRDLDITPNATSDQYLAVLSFKY